MLKLQTFKFISYTDGESFAPFNTFVIFINLVLKKFGNRLMQRRLENGGPKSYEGEITLTRINTILKNNSNLFS